MSRFKIKVPRKLQIRVGGTLGHVGDEVKHGAQQLASNPLVQAGLGLLTGGATIPLLAGAAGGLLKDGDFGDAATGALQGGAAGFAGSKIPMALSKVVGAAPSVASGAGHAASGIGGALKAGASQIAPLALSAFDKLGGVSGILDKGLGVAQLANAANLQRQSTDYAKNAMNTVEQSYGERAPLRVAGLEGLLKPKTQDLSSLRRTAATGNPFGAPIPVGG